MTEVFKLQPKNKTVDCKECDGLGCDQCNKTGRMLIPMPLADRIAHVEKFLDNNYGMTVNRSRK